MLLGVNGRRDVKSRPLLSQPGRPALETAWRPIVSGNRAARAQTVINDIVQLFPRSDSEIKSFLCEQDRNGYDLGRGAAGMAPLFAYLYLVGGDAEYVDIAARFLNAGIDRTCETVFSSAQSFGLYSGLAGVAWVAEHLQGQVFRSNTSNHHVDVNDYVDPWIVRYLQQHSGPLHFDLIAGLAGLAVYALERLNYSSGVALLELVIDRFFECATVAEGYTTWRTSREFIFKEDHTEYPNGYHNLGVAHGVPGVIAVLAQAVAAGIRKDKAELLLTGSVEWLLRQKSQPDSSSCFPMYVEARRKECRLAWCYGDAGIAAALLLAASCMQRSDCEEQALSIAHSAAARPLATARVGDGCFCHGSAGLAHIFNRLYQATEDESFQSAAVHWIDITLNLQNCEKGAAGYLFYTRENDKPAFADRYGLLGGIAGIALTLLAAISNIEPLWDRVFLTNIPPCGARNFFRNRPKNTKLFEANETRSYE